MCVCVCVRERERECADMDVAAEVQGISAFSLELHQTMVKMGNNNEVANNVVVSPLSIAITLALASAGAQGATRKQIAAVLKLPEGDPLHEFSSQLRSVVLADGSGQGGPLLNFVNRTWVEQTLKLKPSFQKLLKDSYGSEAGSVDFLHEVCMLLSTSFFWLFFVCFSAV